MNSRGDIEAIRARIMGINPNKIPYLKGACGWLGATREKNIKQRGERIESVRKNFQLTGDIPAHKGIRL